MPRLTASARRVIIASAPTDSAVLLGNYEPKEPQYEHFIDEFLGLLTRTVSLSIVLLFAREETIN